MSNGLLIKLMDDFWISSHRGLLWKTWWLRLTSGLPSLSRRPPAIEGRVYYANGALNLAISLFMLLTK